MQKIPYSILNNDEASRVKTSEKEFATAYDYTSEVLYSPQFFIQQRSLSLLESIYAEVDFILNAPFIFLKNNETVSEFSSRYGYAIYSDNRIHIPDDAFEVSLGYVKVSSNNKAILKEHRSRLHTTDSTGTVDEECFTWVPLFDHKLVGDLPKEVASYLLVIKYTLNVSALSNFADKLDVDLLSRLGISKSNLKILLHKPYLTGLHFEEPLKFLSPTPTVKRKVLESVVFSVGRTTIEYSDKVFEVIFSDKDTSAILYSESSRQALGNFQLTDSLDTIETVYDVPLNSYSKQSEISYSTNSFKVTYKIPLEVQRILATHLNYKIDIRVTDSTSER